MRERQEQDRLNAESQLEQGNKPMEKEIHELPLCPACERHTLVEEKYKDTYIWVCSECPIVCFEYYDKKNTKQLSERLK